MEMIGEFWSREGEKFSGDTGEVDKDYQNHMITILNYHVMRTLFIHGIDFKDAITL